MLLPRNGQRIACYSAQREQGALHRMGQVIGGVGQRLDPGDADIAGDRDPRQIAVIGTRLQGRRAVCGQRHDGLAEGAQGGQTGGVQRLGGGHKRGLGAVRNHHGQAHAQVGAGAVEPLEGAGSEGHGGPRCNNCPLDVIHRGAN